MEEIGFLKTEKKWQDRWEMGKIFEVRKSNRKKSYVLEMFPYLSSGGLC